MLSETKALNRFSLMSIMMMMVVMAMMVVGIPGGRQDTESGSSKFKIHNDIGLG